MSQHFHAIYEGGVLRPLTPLNLPESAQVTVEVHEQNGSTTATPADLESQQQELEAMFAVVDKLPQTPTGDGLSGRDHDQILYGQPK
jgi:predicted DNA-binding antitoxin AbrB/MazE fold protein